MSETVTIDSRFNGPPASANGGYGCGAVAGLLEAPIVESTLRVPPPLDRPLEVKRPTADEAELWDGETLVAEARSQERLDRSDVPEPVSLEDAAAASAGSPLRHAHPFPRCFVCGSERGPGDGLGVICGPVEGRDVVASPWRVDDSVPLDTEGQVANEIVWSVLDCPSGNAMMMLPEGVPIAVLGRLTAEILEPIAPGEDYVAMGWLIDRDGRKTRSGSAILSTGGDLLAHSRAIWIDLPEA